MWVSPRETWGRQQLLLRVYPVKNEKWRSMRKFVPPSPFVPHLKVATREEEKCVRRALEEIAADVASFADCRAEKASEEESFIDIMASLEIERERLEVNPKGSFLLTLCKRAGLLSETLLEDVFDTTVLLLC